MSPEVAVAIIKPDSTRDFLDEMLIEDISNTGLKVISRKLCKLDENAIKYIYPEKISDPVYPSAVRAMVFGQAMILLIEGENVYARLKQVKGKMDKNGIRHKYCTHTVEDLKAAGYEGRRLQDRLAENRFHSSDTLEESALILVHCMCYKDREFLKDIAPQLYETTRKITALTRTNNANC